VGLWITWPRRGDKEGADGLVREGVARPSGWASAQMEEGAGLRKRERKRR
jgi:hypothetical protein